MTALGSGEREPPGAEFTSISCTAATDCGAYTCNTAQGVCNVACFGNNQCATADVCTRALLKAGAGKVTVLCWARVVGDTSD